MNIPQGICTKCGSDFFQCHCDQFHPNIGNSMTLDELQIIRVSLVRLDLIGGGNVEEAIKIVDREIKLKTMDPRSWTRDIHGNIINGD